MFIYLIYYMTNIETLTNLKEYLVSQIDHRINIKLFLRNGVRDGKNMPLGKQVCPNGFTSVIFKQIQILLNILELLSVSMSLVCHMFHKQANQVD